MFKQSKAVQEFKKKEKPLIKKYGRVTLRFQLLAEYNLTKRERAAYKVALDELNEKRKKQGKEPK